MKKIILNSLRVTVSVGLLAYLIYLADVDKIVKSLKAADARYFGLALLFFLFGVALLSKRWHILLNQVEIRAKYSQLVNFYFIGFF